jgi:hypothetical protein
MEGLRRILRVPLRPRTTGPLQIARGPFNFGQAVTLAAELIEGNAHDVETLARLWNGRVDREPGSRVAYADALLEAERVLRVEPRVRRANRHSADPRRRTREPGA